MPCKQVLLAFDVSRGRRRLRAACAHDRCAPLHRRHHHRNRQHQRHDHDMSYDTGEHGHRRIVVGERAIDLRCMWQVLDGKTKPCAVRSVMSGRSLATSQTDSKLSCQCGRGLLRIWLCAVAAQPVVLAHDAFRVCAAARANQRPAATISELTMESSAG